MIFNICSMLPNNNLKQIRVGLSSEYLTIINHKTEGSALSSFISWPVGAPLAKTAVNETSTVFEGVKEIKRF